MRVAHYREAFLPSESITETAETGTTRRRRRRQRTAARRRGGVAVDETAGNWRQSSTFVESRASLKSEIALASTFSREGIKARTNEIAESHEPSTYN